MTELLIEINNEKKWFYADKKDNHWYFKDTNIIINPESIHGRRDKK